jgi:hypothetical protein
MDDDTTEQADESGIIDCGACGALLPYTDADDRTTVWRAHEANCKGNDQ